MVSLAAVMFILLLLAQFREFVEGRRELVLKIHKFLDTESGLLNNGTQGSFGDIFSRVVGNDGASACCWIKPDFMASLGMPVKDETGFSEFANDISGFKRRKRTHASTGTGILKTNFLWGANFRVMPLGIGSPCSMQDSTILRATSSAISRVSAMVRPWAINPCRTELVAKYPPSSRGSIDMGINDSDIEISPFVASVSRLSTVCQWQKLNSAYFRGFSA